MNRATSTDIMIDISIHAELDLVSLFANSSGHPSSQLASHKKSASCDWPDLMHSSKKGSPMKFLELIDMEASQLTQSRYLMTMRIDSPMWQRSSARNKCCYHIRTVPQTSHIRSKPRSILQLTLHMLFATLHIRQLLLDFHTGHPFLIQQGDSLFQLQLQHPQSCQIQSAYQ